MYCRAAQHAASDLSVIRPASKPLDKNVILVAVLGAALVVLIALIFIVLGSFAQDERTDAGSGRRIAAIDDEDEEDEERSNTRTRAPTAAPATAAPASAYAPSPTPAYTPAPASNPASATLAGEALEEEILRIRAIWDYDSARINANEYSESIIQNGVTAYSSNGEIKRIVAAADNGNEYMRVYQYDNGNFVFAYYENERDKSQVRMYYKNGILFRLRYTDPSGSFLDYDNAFDVDNYVAWQKSTLKEAYELHDSATRTRQ
ncbi:MAG: hypothetical protein LBT59_01120 [Clostridiales bacterium]|jgi:hypothetical protein|nr:hypothetical protein [Clostridiales bacterium]